MAAKKTVAKKEKSVDYKELCDLYEHLLDHKNLDIEFLSDENEVLKKTVQGKDKFAATQMEKISKLDSALAHATREMAAAHYSRELLLDTNTELLETVQSVKTDRIALVILSLALVCVIIFVK